MNQYQNLRTNLKSGINNILNISIIPLLIKLKLTPNKITVVGLLSSIITMILIAEGYLLISGVMIIISSLFDLIDGSLARYTNSASKLGGFFDAVIDRISESIIYLGLLIYFVNDSHTAIIIFLSALINQLVSYVKSKYESYGVEGEVGIFTRTERVIVLSLALILGSYNLFILYLLLYVSILLSFISLIQRLIYGLTGTKNK
ncbi:MAG: hypothetical protein CL730_01255 [Chloroflexi bacterium]|nr:hypothetical protein [Chloroflexota bacterium]